MTIETKISKKEYLGNGIAVDFPIPFPVAINVLTSQYNLRAILTSPDPNDATKTIDTEIPYASFTISVTAQPTPSNPYPSLSVKYPITGVPIVPIPTGSKITLFRDTPRVQGVSLINPGSFNAQVVELGGLDWEMMVIQEQEEKLERAVTVPITSVETPEEFMERFWGAVDSTEANAAAAAASAASTAADVVTTNANVVTCAASEAAAAQSVLDAADQVALAIEQVQLAKDWANKLGGPVQGDKYSSQYWAEYADRIVNTLPDPKNVPHNWVIYCENQTGVHGKWKTGPQTAGQPIVFSTVLAQDMSIDDLLTVPSYVTGAHELTVHVQGNYWTSDGPEPQYIEVGSGTSTQIQIKHPILATQRIDLKHLAYGATIDPPIDAGVDIKFQMAYATAGVDFVVDFGSDSDLSEMLIDMGNGDVVIPTVPLFTYPIDSTGTRFIQIQSAVTAGIRSFKMAGTDKTSLVSVLKFDATGVRTLESAFEGQTGLQYFPQAGLANKKQLVTAAKMFKGTGVRDLLPYLSHDLPELDDLTSFAEDSEMSGALPQYMFGGLPGATKFTNVLKGCVNVTGLVTSDTFNGSPNGVNFDGAFEGTSLTGIADFALKGMLYGTSAIGMFKGAPITTECNGLFDDWVALIDASYALANTLIPKVPSYAFRRCLSLLNSTGAFSTTGEATILTWGELVYDQVPSIDAMNFVDLCRGQTNLGGFVEEIWDIYEKLNTLGTNAFIDCLLFVNRDNCKVSWGGTRVDINQPTTILPLANHTFGVTGIYGRWNIPVSGGMTQSGITVKLSTDELGLNVFLLKEVVGITNVYMFDHADIMGATGYINGMQLWISAKVNTTDGSSSVYSTPVRILVTEDTNIELALTGAAQLQYTITCSSDIVGTGTNASSGSFPLLPGTHVYGTLGSATSHTISTSVGKITQFKVSSGAIVLTSFTKFRAPWMVDLSYGLIDCVNLSTQAGPFADLKCLMATMPLLVSCLMFLRGCHLVGDGQDIGDDFLEFNKLLATVNAMLQDTRYTSIGTHALSKKPNLSDMGNFAKSMEQLISVGANLTTDSLGILDVQGAFKGDIALVSIATPTIDPDNSVTNANEYQSGCIAYTGHLYDWKNQTNPVSNVTNAYTGCTLGIEYWMRRQQGMTNEAASVLSVGRSAMRGSGTSGRVAFGGGLISGGSDSNVVEIFNVQNGSRVVNTLSQPRQYPTTGAAGTKVLFMGGVMAPSNRSNVVDIVDVLSNTKTADTLSVPRMHGIGVSGLNHVACAGGQTASGITTDIDIFNTTTLSKTSTNLGVARYGGAGVGTDTVGYIIGGAGSNDPSVARLNSVEELVYATNTVSTSAFVLSEGRNNLGGAKAGNYIVAAGGTTNSSPSLAIDLWDYTTSTQSIVFLPAGAAVYFAQGVGDLVYMPDSLGLLVYVLDTTTMTITTITQASGTPTFPAYASDELNNTFVAAGGTGQSNAVIVIQS